VKIVTFNMAYATSDMVKYRMRIPITDTTRDAEIAAAITFSDAFCDGVIRAAGGSVPVASPPQDLKEASADFAAFFIFRTQNPTVANFFMDSGETLIKRYTSGTVKSAGAMISGKSGIRDET